MYLRLPSGRHPWGVCAPAITEGSAGRFSEPGTVTPSDQPPPRVFWLSMFLITELIGHINPQGEIKEKIPDKQLSGCTSATRRGITKEQPIGCS